MKYKMLITDLDGTLLTKFNKVSNKNLEAIKDYVNNGGIFTIATGRSPYKAQKIINLIKQKTDYQVPYIACFNGAYIYDVVHQKVIFEAKLDFDIVSEIHKYAINNNLGFWTYNDAYMQKQQLEIYNINYQKLLQWTHPNHKIMFNPEQLKKQEAYKINLIPNKLFKRINKKIYQELLILFGDRVEISFTANFVIEITKKGVSKQLAVDHFSDLCQVNKEQIATIGDSSNDIAMFKTSGLAVAARLKSKHIKKYVHLVMHQKNNKNAVAKLINKHLLLK